MLCFKFQVTQRIQSGKKYQNNIINYSETNLFTLLD